MGSSNIINGVSDDSATDTDCATTTSTPTVTTSRTEKDPDIDNDTGDECPPPLGSSPFVEGEKVLIYHKTQIYEAKVREVDYHLEQWRFLVHYLGWSKNWDEWAGVDRLLKHNEENLLLQAQKKLSVGKNTKTIRVSQLKPKNSNVPRGRKRKSESVKEKAAMPMDKLVNIQIPMKLKKQLVDDCELVTHLGKLVKLPRIPNVNDIFKKYLDYKLKKDGLVPDSVEEILKGLRCYFDKALPVILLYENERQQYETSCGHDSPSTIYGAEHLLRLFVKLPELLFHANIEEETLMELQSKLADFLKFLQKNQSTFFLSSYLVSSDIENSINIDKQDA